MAAAAVQSPRALAGGVVCTGARVTEEAGGWRDPHSSVHRERGKAGGRRKVGASARVHACCESILHGRERRVARPREMPIEKSGQGINQVVSKRFDFKMFCILIHMCGEVKQWRWGSTESDWLEKDSCATSLADVVDPNGTLSTVQSGGNFIQ